MKKQKQFYDADGCEDMMMKNNNFLLITLIVALCFLLCVFIYAENGKFFFF